MYPRLLVTGFAETFRFYDAVLPKLIDAHLMKGTEAGPYASWDVGEEGALSLLDQGAMAALAGTADLPRRPPAQDSVMLVCRVADVAAAHGLCLAHGAQDVAGPTPRPDWGPTCRTAHVRDPDGNLLELQSY